jgi:hypothetical protein
MAKGPKLKGNSLHHLLIEEIDGFIAGLDSGTLEMLRDKKARIKEILDLIREKEGHDTALIPWGKNSTNAAKIIPITETTEQSELGDRSASDIS